MQNSHQSIPTHFSNGNQENQSYRQNSQYNQYPQQNYYPQQQPYQNLNQQNTYPNNKPQMNYHRYSQPQNSYPGYQPQPQNFYRGNLNNQQNLQNQFIGNEFKLALWFIEQYADQVFDKHDWNRSGYLDVYEIYPAIQEIFQIKGYQPPSYEYSLNIMRSFDTDGNGLIDKAEFRRLLKDLQLIYQ